MSKAQRYTTRAIVNGEVDLIGTEVRKANRMPGRNGWYCDVLFTRQGARYAATGRLIEDDGSVSDRVEFAEGPAHQTYEVREIADINVALTRLAVHHMRGTVTLARQYGSRVVPADLDIDTLMYRDLPDLIAAIRVDAEAQAYEQTEPTFEAITFKRVAAGHYEGGGFTIRRDQQANTTNRWVVREGTERVSAHRTLDLAMSAASHTRDRRRLAAAATATVQAMREQPQQQAAQADIPGPIDRQSILSHRVESLLHSGTTDATPPAEPEPEVDLFDLAASQGYRLRVNPAHPQSRKLPVELLHRNGGVLAMNFRDVGQCRSWLDQGAIRDAEVEATRYVPALGDVVTIDPLRKSRQYDVIAIGPDDMVRVMPRNPRDVEDSARWVSTTYLAPVPADLIEPVEDDCEGHESLDGASMGETTYCDGSCRTHEQQPVVNAGAIARTIEAQTDTVRRETDLGLFPLDLGEVDLDREATADECGAAFPSPRSEPYRVLHCVLPPHGSYVAHSVLSKGAEYGVCGGLVVTSGHDRLHVDTIPSADIVTHREADCGDVDTDDLPVEPQLPTGPAATVADVAEWLRFYGGPRGASRHVAVRRSRLTEWAGILTPRPTIADMLMPAMPAQYREALEHLLTPCGFAPPAGVDLLSVDDANPEAFLIHDPTGIAVGVYDTYVRLSYPAPHGGAPDEEFGPAFLDLAYGTSFEVVADVAVGLIARIMRSTHGDHMRDVAEALHAMADDRQIVAEGDLVGLTVRRNELRALANRIAPADTECKAAGYARRVTAVLSMLLGQLVAEAEPGRPVAAERLRQVALFAAEALTAPEAAVGDLAEYLKGKGVGAAIVADESVTPGDVDELVDQLVAMGWQMAPEPEYVLGKRVRYLTPTTAIDAGLHGSQGMAPDIEPHEPTGRGKACVRCGRDRDAAVHAGESLAQARDLPVVFDGGEGVGLMPAFVVGWCGHRVARSEWIAGLRTCERCPEGEHAPVGPDDTLPCGCRAEQRDHTCGPSAPDEFDAASEV
jgi:hypothetical protein